MKFFWKIFFTTMFVSITCFSIGGYLLIHSNFQTLLSKEVEISQDLSDIVYYSLSDGLENSYITVIENQPFEHTLIGQVAQSMNINSTGQKISFCIMDSEGKVLFSSLKKEFDKNMIDRFKEGDRGWSIKKADGKYYVQAVRPASFLDNTFYIEVLRDATFVFDSQNQQYATLLKIMAAMFLLASLITFSVSKFLMGRVTSLRSAARALTAGNLEKRVAVKGSDEFADLAYNFNLMAEELSKNIQGLKEEAEKQERFVAAFSHELKTPLTSIIGYADTLRRKELGPEQANLCAEYIFTEGKRLEALSMRLLDLIVLKNQELRLIPSDIRKLLAEVCALMTPRLLSSGIELSCTAHPSLLLLEPELMKTVLLNLIDNGRKAIDNTGTIRICGEKQGDSYRIAVSDTGKGMAAEELLKIKEAFYMVDKSRSRRQGGAGLGLSICDEVLTLHGFSINFESAVNVGTTVTIIMKGAVHE